jgi:hypothetical protein
VAEAVRSPTRPRGPGENAVARVGVGVVVQRGYHVREFGDVVERVIVVDVQVEGVDLLG